MSQDLWTCRVGDARGSHVFFAFVFCWGTDSTSMLLGTLEQVREILSFFILFSFGTECGYIFIFIPQFEIMWHRLHHGQSSMVSIGILKDPLQFSHPVCSRSDQ